ncbi:hypothetical protein MCM45_03435 [Providencia rettgeri]|uniref:phage tail fiber protein n=1 Tax=Providencia rettgeri TaxID=587 RepID=UPI001EFCF92B|nr:hypothetical protein [Providencia rettgeri]MCG9525588.1 hypothetical protein [Providencia rettgeri]
MYSTGTVTTTANSTKLVGTGTKWLNNINRVSAEQAIQIQIGTTVHNNSIQSIQSDTELTLNFPLPAAATGAKYVILTTMVHSVSDAMNKIVSMNGANVQFSDILMRWMTEQGIITVTLPDQTTQQLRTTKEMDKQLDGKFDKSGGTVTGPTTFNHANVRIHGANDWTSLRLIKQDGSYAIIQTNPASDAAMLSISNRDKDDKTLGLVSIPNRSGTAMLVGDYGWGNAGSGTAGNWDAAAVIENFRTGVSRIWRTEVGGSDYAYRYAPNILFKTGDTFTNISTDIYTGITKITSGISANTTSYKHNTLWGSSNTTKDSNGNLKAASPVVKLFADDIELNEESEGVEMEHLGIGHYLIKGVVGFNADGAWGINNGFVIPQDHNGKNMVLIDYEVRPDGDIEVFVFHQQNADMPERFQNKRIKHFDEEGAPVYFENYEPCDVPESRWIDMRVEMPPNSLYNQKQAEAERLAKIEAERLAQEEAKRAAEEAERAEQETFEGGNDSSL